MARPPVIGNGSETSPIESPAIKGLTTEGRFERFCHFIFPLTSLVGATEYANAASENSFTDFIFLSVSILWFA